MVETGSGGPVASTPRNGSILIWLRRAGVLVLGWVIVSFVHSKPLASEFLDVEKTKWRRLLYSENIGVFQIPVDVKRPLPMPSQFNVAMIYAECNTVKKAWAESESAEQCSVATFREGKVFRQLSVNAGLEIPISRSDGTISRSSPRVAECDIEGIVQDPFKLFRTVITPLFCAREANIGYEHIGTQFLAGDFSRVFVGFFGGFGGLSGGFTGYPTYLTLLESGFDLFFKSSQRIGCNLGLFSYGPPLQSGETGINGSDSKQAVVYPPRLLIGTGFLVGGTLLISYGTKGFNERLFKLGWSYALSLVFGIGLFYLGGVLIFIRSLW